MSSNNKIFNLSTGHLFYIFVGVLLVIALVSGYFLIGERIREITTEFQERSSRVQAETAASSVGTYLDDRIQLIKDLSAQPILSNAVMDTLTSRQNLVDYLNSYRILGRIESLYLLNILGEPIYQSTREDLGDIVEDQPWFQEIINGERPWVIQKYRRALQWQFSVVLPVKYNGASEGAILVRFNDPIRDLTGTDGTGNATQIRGDFLEYSSLDKAVKYQKSIPCLRGIRDW